MTPEEFNKECARMIIQNRDARLQELAAIKPPAARDRALQQYWKLLGAALEVTRPKNRKARRRRRRPDQQTPEETTTDASTHNA